MKKTLLANILLGIICISSFADFQKNLQTQAAYQQYMNPGMQIRLEQATIEGMKQAMARFLPRYIKYDMDLPTHLEYKFDSGMGLFDWNFRWTDIKYSQPQLDILDVQFNFTRNSFWDTPEIQIDFPAIESWEIAAHQQLNTWILPS